MIKMLLSTANEGVLIQDTTKPRVLRNLNELCLFPRWYSFSLIWTYLNSKPFFEGLWNPKDFLPPPPPILIPVVEAGVVLIYPLWAFETS